MNPMIRTLAVLFSAIAVAAASGCGSTPQRESAGEYVDDTVITTKVKAAIVKEPNLSAAEVNVETYKGVVQLSGFVSSEADIRRAVELARAVEGVTSVKNDMRVK